MAIKDAIITYVKGVDRRNPGFFAKHRQSIVNSCREGQTLLLIREPDNPEDPNAIKVIKGKKDQMGYLSRHVASQIAPLIDKGCKATAKVREIQRRDYGFECLIECYVDGYKFDEDRNPVNEADFNNEAKAQSLIKEARGFEKDNAKQAVKLYQEAIELLINLDIVKPKYKRRTRIPINQLSRTLEKQELYAECLELFKYYDGIRDQLGLTKSDISTIEKRKKRMLKK